MATQLDLVSELGAGWYRVDLGSDAFLAETARFDKLLSEAERRGIGLLPILVPMPGCRSQEATPAQVREAAFAFASTMAERYRGRITHWELDNELDIVAMIRKGETTRRGGEWKWGAPDGSSPDDYEEGRYLKARAEIQGLYDGIKAADPRARTIVDTSGWLHYGFIERVANEDHLQFDILAWHWYSEMGDITRVQGAIDLPQRLKRYGKPLWITETSRRDGSLGGREPELAEYVATAVARMGANPEVGGVFVYELLDEPYLGDGGDYGLVTVTRDAQNRWSVARRKRAFEAYKAVIRASR
jgi:hypothetical protein